MYLVLHLLLLLGGSLQEIVDNKIRPLFGLMSAGAKFFNRCVYLSLNAAIAHFSKETAVLQNNTHFMILIYFLSVWV